MLADERRRDLTRLGERASRPRPPEPLPEQRMEDRFLEPVEHEPAPTPSSHRATSKVWRQGREPRFSSRVAADRLVGEHSVRERELDRV